MPVNMQNFNRWTAAMTVFLLSALNAAAQTLVWDAAPGTAGQQNGSGSWLGAGQWWDGTNNVTWDNSGGTIAQLGTTGSALV
ncbi:MAG: hypothetical protein JWO94_2274, partial [Verrucomicrobiaceae bacterium]|nr:hypothetical protein [Verrucomicrobiaceae bacterium]